MLEKELQVAPAPAHGHGPWLGLHVLFLLHPGLFFFPPLFSSLFPRENSIDRQFLSGPSEYLSEAVLGPKSVSTKSAAYGYFGFCGYTWNTWKMLG